MNGLATFSGLSVDNIGTGYTLTATSNPALTSAVSNAFNIDPRLITVTAQAASKGYDGNNSSSVLPQVTSGSIASGDTGTFTQTYDNANVGTGKTLTPTGTVTDGNGGNNYTITFAPANVGTITSKLLTITAVGIDREYDGTAVAPVTLSDDREIRRRGLHHLDRHVRRRQERRHRQADHRDHHRSDWRGWRQLHLQHHRSHGCDRHAARDHGQRRDPDPRVRRDHQRGAAQIVGTIAAGDTHTFAQAFDTKHVGTDKVITASGAIDDGNGGANYDLAFGPTALGSITTRALTVTAVTDVKEYDGTTVSLVAPDVSAPGVAIGDTATFSQVFNSAAVGTGKTLTPSGSIDDGNSGNNYALTFTPVNDGEITLRTLTVTATGVDRPYDGTNIATVTLETDALEGDDVEVSYGGATFADKHAGIGKIVTVTGITISGGDDMANYTLGNTGETTTADISPIALAVDATGDDKVYDGTDDATVTFVDDRIGGDLFTIAYTATFDDGKAVGTGKAVSVTGINLTGPDAGDYTPNTTDTTTADITTLTVYGSFTAPTRSTTATPRRPSSFAS